MRSEVNTDAPRSLLRRMGSGRATTSALAVMVAFHIHGQEVHIPLNDGWSFCQVGQGQWHSAEVPGAARPDP